MQMGFDRGNYHGQRYTNYRSSNWLAKKYNIHHIRISAYNKQANGLAERNHRSISESIVKACDGDISRWPEVTPHVFWADRVTVRKHLGFSPFYMVHGVEPILPFDIVEATYLLPKLDKPLSTEDLVAVRARQLQKRPKDLQAIHDLVLKSRFDSITQLEKEHANLIVDFDFKEGSLALVRNSRIETGLSHKTKPHYLGSRRCSSVGIKYANVCAVLVYIGEYSASVLYLPSKYFPMRNIFLSH